MAKKRESFFWTSYSDLMTSLFFIMLVLFVLVIVLLYRRMADTQIKLEDTKRKLEEIQKIEASTKDLNPRYFDYREEYKKYVLNIPVTFPARVSNIDQINVVNKEITLQELKEAGIEIRDFLKNHSEYQYLLIIEGQASRDNYPINYELSYERALGLIKYWMEDCSLVFGENCEIQIAGSGDGKLPTKSMRENGDEKKNQRFLIHILPKNIIR